HHGYFESFLYRWDIFFWNCTPYNFVDKLQWMFGYVPIFISRRDDHLDVRKLTTTTRLFLIDFTMFSLTVDRLFVGYLRSSLVDFNFEFTSQTIDKNIQVKFSHSCDDP